MAKRKLILKIESELDGDFDKFNVRFGKGLTAVECAQAVATMIISAKKTGVIKENKEFYDLVDRVLGQGFKEMEN